MRSGNSSITVLPGAAGEYALLPECPAGIPAGGGFVVKCELPGGHAEELHQITVRWSGEMMC